MKSCPICHKGSIMVGSYSTKVRATKFNPAGFSRKQPNLQWARLTNGQRIKICTTCLKKNRHLTTKV